MTTLILMMTQYTRLLCLVCLTVHYLALTEQTRWDDSGLSGSNMGLRILKRNKGQVGRVLKRDPYPTMNMVNNEKI